MPNNLSPEILAMLQQAGSPMLQDGRWYQPTFSGQTYGEDATPGQLDGYLSYLQSDHNAPDSPYQQYGVSGEYAGEGKQQSPESGAGWKLAFMLASLGGAGYDAGMFGGASGAGSAASGLGSSGADIGLANSLSDAGYAGADWAGAGLGGSGAGTGVMGLDHVNGADLMSDAFTSNGGYGPGGFGGGTGAVNGAFDYVNGADQMSDAYTGNGPGGFGPPATTSLTSGTGNPFDKNMLSTLTKVAGLLNTGGGGSSGGDDTTASAPFDYGDPRWTPPGWRQDRPMYRPGVDAVPDGWNAPGHGFT